MDHRRYLDLILGSRSSARTDRLLGPSETSDLTTVLEWVNLLRLDAYRRITGDDRARLGQFLTPPPTARLMASMLDAEGATVRLLDAGAGVGMLSIASVIELLRRTRLPREIVVTAYEIEPVFIEYLHETMRACQALCSQLGVMFSSHILEEDFIDAGVGMIGGGLFAPAIIPFSCAILNPPYGKIQSRSRTRMSLRTVGIEANNLYTAFLWLAMRLLNPEGEIVAITPRSFCNGPYFRPFRQALLDSMYLKRVHVFESRADTFREDSVLQENVIFHAMQGSRRASKVVISSSRNSEDESIISHEVDYRQVVLPNDPQRFIHLVTDDLGRQIAEKMNRFSNPLDALGISVSTGRVVDFRVGKYLRAMPESNTAPLIYPAHFNSGIIVWPKPKSRKPNAIVDAPETRELLVPNGNYVLVRRFSAKEERRRVVAAVFDPSQVSDSWIGFENHLNYYHDNGHGLPRTLARGLSAFLNSTLVDEYFRQFNGHTQVNATDLRNLRYPTRAQLQALGTRLADTRLSQDQLDHYIEEELLQMADDTSVSDPIRAKKRIDEARALLKDLGLPPQQRNERSALTLLALLDLKPSTPWSQADSPMLGITPMMDFFARYYGKRYAPNTRETVRRQTVHQFLDAGLIVANPDDPARPINSGKTVYQVEASTLELLRTYGFEGWHERLREYLTSTETLRRRYISERQLIRIPLAVAPGKVISLSPGGQNVLIKQIVDEFCPRFTPEATLIYVGDTDEKFAYFDQEALERLGVTVEPHGKMPDVVVYHSTEDWLVLIEAVTTHGPVDPKRRNELRRLFHDSSAGLVFVTAFLDRGTMKKYVNDISWETEVWVAEAPDHLIHFNGERFLGPY
jgi:adenine-specific DNA-methyltransferase